MIVGEDVSFDAKADKRLVRIDDSLKISGSFVTGVFVSSSLHEVKAAARIATLSADLKMYFIVVWFYTTTVKYAITLPIPKIKHKKKPVAAPVFRET
jgi:hypothetical protein